MKIFDFFWKSRKNLEKNLEKIENFSLFRKFPNFFFDRKYFLKKLKKNPDINIEVKFHCGSNGSTPSLWKPLQTRFLDRVSFFPFFCYKPYHIASHLVKSSELSGQSARQPTQCYFKKFFKKSLKKLGASRLFSLKKIRRFAAFFELFLRNNS